MEFDNGVLQLSAFFSVTIGVVLFVGILITNLIPN
jgi:hypothetical protein